MLFRSSPAEGFVTPAVQGKLADRGVKLTEHFTVAPCTALSHASLVPLERCAGSGVTADDAKYLVREPQTRAAALHNFPQNNSLPQANSFPRVKYPPTQVTHVSRGKDGDDDSAALDNRCLTDQNAYQQCHPFAPTHQAEAEGGSAPQTTAPVATEGRCAPQSTCVMEQLFPEIFYTAKRLDDVCHCGELAHRTCPCGARTCHNHFYDGDGNLARRDHAGFCAECVDLIREEAAGIERYGRAQ